MRYWAPILIAVLASGLFLPSASAAPEVISFSSDQYNVGVSPEDPEEFSLNATLRNPYLEDTVFMLTADIPSSPTWGVEVQNRITVPALEQRTIPLKLFIPRGEPAFRESELQLKATVLDKSATWQGQCRIRTMPFFAASFDAVEDVLVDMPLSGYFNVTLRNDGNAGNNLSYIQDGSFPLGFDLEPGESKKIFIPYTVSEDTTLTLEPISQGRKGDPLTARIIVDGERAHVLIDRLTALVIMPAGPNAVNVLPIGSSAKILSATAVEGNNIGIQMVELSNLQRIRLQLDPGKDQIRRTALIRINATMNGETVESNPIPVLLLVKERVDRGYRVTPVMAGGIGGAVVVTVGTMGYLYAAVEGFRYKWLTMAFIPLYSIIHGEKVLDHFFRGRLYEYIKENPGVTFTALKKHFEVNNGNLTYHLHKLEREELIVSRVQGKFKLFYPDGIRLRDTEIVISLMDKDIMDIVSSSPGISSLDVIKQLAGTRSKRTVSRHIKDLERKGLIEAYGEHRKLYLSKRYDSAIVKDGLRLSLDVQAAQ